MKTIEASIRVTARQNLVQVLAQEILSGAYDPKFPIPSEHQLCKRFGVSRVTVRLALSDLQYRGLIYRHHGKGTFIYGASKFAGKPLAILMRAPERAACPSLAELIRGFQAYMAAAETYSITTGASPESWSPSMASQLGGVAVVPEGVTAADLDSLHKRHLPFLIIGASSLEEPTLHMGTAAATYEVVSRLLQEGKRHFAFLHGNESPYDRLKMQGLSNALSQSGFSEATVQNCGSISAPEEVRKSAHLMFEVNPLPQVVLASEAVHVAATIAAAKERGLVLGKDLRIISFANTVCCRVMDPSIITVDLAFYEGGKLAAKALCQASYSGKPLEPTISLPYHIHWPL